MQTFISVKNANKCFSPECLVQVCVRLGQYLVYQHVIFILDCISRRQNNQFIFMHLTSERAMIQLSQPSSARAGSVVTVILCVSIFHILKSNLQSIQHLGCTLYFIRYAHPPKIIFIGLFRALSDVCFCLFVCRVIQNC